MNRSINIKSLCSFVFLLAFVGLAYSQGFGIQGESNVCRNATEVYQLPCPASDITWSVEGGVPQDSESNATMRVLWNGTGTGRISASYKCYGLPSSEQLNITITDPGTAGGTIGGSSSICSGKSVNLDAGSSGTILGWEHSTNGSSFTPIDGNKSQQRTFSPSVNTWYRVRKSGVGACSQVYTRSKKITIRPPLSTPGAITPNSQSLCPNETPAELSIGSVSGGSGSYSYLWEVSSDNNDWAPAPGANTGTTYQPQASVGSQAYYRYRVTSLNCDAVYSSSATVTQAVNVNFSISGNTEFCDAGTVQLSFNAPSQLFDGPGNTATMRWWRYHVSSGWDPLPDQIVLGQLNTLSRSAMDGERYQVRITYSGLCATEVSNEKVITVESSQTSEQITGLDYSVCYNESFELNGGPGTIIEWQHSTDGIGYTRIDGNTNRNRSFSRTSDTWYRVKKVGTGICNAVLTQPRKITVYSALAAGAPSPAADELCATESPSSLSVGTPTGGNGSYSYLWEVSSNNIDWAPAPGENTEDTYLPQIGSEGSVTYYRYRVTSANCNAEAFSSSSVIRKLANINFSISGNTEFCDAGTVQLSFNAPSQLFDGPGNTATMRWWRYHVSSGWDPLPDQIVLGQLNTLSRSAMDGERYQVRITYSGSCATEVSNEKVITVESSQTSEQITGLNYSVCYNESFELNGGPGTIIEWQHSTDGIGYTRIDGDTDPTRDFSVTSDTWYRVKKVGTGICNAVFTQPRKITVYSALAAGAPSPAADELCATESPSSLSVGTPTGGNGSYSYLWEVSSNNIDWAPAPGENTEDTYLPQISNEGSVTYYRYRVTSANCNAEAFSSSSVIRKLANINFSISGNTEFCDAGSIALSFDAPEYLFDDPDNTATMQWWRYHVSSGWDPLPDQIVLGQLNTLSRPAMDGERYQVRVTYSGSCATEVSNEKVITVESSQTSEQITGLNYSVCYNESFELDGGPGTIIEWQHSTDGIGYTRIDGDTDPTRDFSVTSDTWYRVKKVGTGICNAVFTQPRKITVYSALAAGAPSPAADELCATESPSSLSLGTPTGGNGSYSYLWEVSSNNIDWAPAPGENTEDTYLPQISNEGSVTYYRYRVTSANCNAEAFSSSSVIRKLANINFSISGNTEFCDAGSIALSFDAPEYLFDDPDNTATMQWWRYHVSSGWDPLPDQIVLGQLNTLSRPAMDGERYQVRVTYSGSCATEVSNEKVITVESSQTSEQITGLNYSVCYNESFELDGGPGTIIEWQHSTDGIGYTRIDGNTNRNRSFSKTSDTWYRVMKVGTGICNAVLTQPRKITVYSALAAGAPSPAADELCATESPSSLSVGTPTGGNGSYSYLWEVSSNNIDWAPAPGENTEDTYLPQIGSEGSVTYYRYRVTSANCNAEAFSSSSVIRKLVNVNFSISGNTEFCDADSVELSFFAPEYLLDGPGNTATIQWWRYHVSSDWDPLPDQIVLGELNTLKRLARDGERYRVQVNYSGDCAIEISNEKIVNVQSSYIPDNISFVGEFFSNASGTVEALGNEEMIVRWESRDVGSPMWEDEGNAGSNTFSFSFDRTKEVRYVVDRPICGELGSPARMIKVNHRFFAGNIQGTDNVIGLANSGNLSLQNQQMGSTVVRWESASSPAGAITQIANTSTQLELTNLNSDHYYRALVDYLGTEEYTDWKLVSHYEQVTDIVAEANVLKVTSLRSSIQEPTRLALFNAAKRERYSYTDGLGRTVQSVWKGVSPQQKDLVSINEYTHYGTQERSYLPYVASGHDFYSDSYSEQLSFYGRPPTGVASTRSPFSEVVLDDSPYQRVLEQGAVGSDWQIGTTHTIKNQIGLNEANEVRKWDTQGMPDGTYQENELAISLLTDENGHTTRSYVDKSGNTVLKVVDLESSALKTYYVFDAFNRLIHQVPPKAVTLMESGSNYNLGAANVNGLIFSYAYDSRGRLIEKKVPGGGVEEYVYDQLNRQVLSRNNNLAAANKWRFVKYDRNNRSIYSGIYTNTLNTTRQSLQDVLNNMNYEGADTYFEERDTVAAFGYTNRSFPTTNLEVLASAFFDDYSFSYASDTAFHFTPEMEYTAYTPPIFGMATGSMTKVLGESRWIRSISYYNDRYRPIQEIRDENRGGGLQRTTIRYDFVGNVLETNQLLGSEQLVFQNSYTYDHTDRLLSVGECITDVSTPGNPPSCVQLVANEYNELGQLINKDLHVTSGRAGDEALQSIDYRYNIRGWLKSINTPSLDVTSDINLGDDNPDLFGMELIYHQPIDGVPNQTDSPR